MVFKFLSKPKATINIAAQNRVLPGALLPVGIRLNAQEEIKAREVRAELVGEETYYVKETHHDSKGHTSTRLVQKTNTLARITQTVADQSTFLRGTEQHWSLSLQLPPDAPPTCIGKLVNIRWSLKTVIDTPNRPDTSQEVPLTVLCLPPQASRINELPAEKVFNDVGMNLEIPPLASPGETLIGRLNLQMKDKVNTQGIRIELVQNEDTGARSAVEVVAKTEISGSTSYGEFDAPSLEFSLNIPAEAPPTAQSFHSSLHWRVKAVVARRLRSDFNVEREVFIYNATEPTIK
jgi:hypothetical protein